MITIDEARMPDRLPHELRQAVDRQSARFRRRRLTRRAALASTALAVIGLVVASGGSPSVLRTSQTAGPASAAEESTGPHGNSGGVGYPRQSSAEGTEPTLPPQTIPPGVPLPPPPPPSPPAPTEKAVIAFTEHQKIIVMAVDGTGRRTLDVTNATSPTWMPNGRRLAYVNSDRNLEEYDLATNTRRVLVQREGWHVESPSWSPDGSIIVYRFGARFGNLQLDTRETGLWMLDMRTGETKQLNTGGEDPSVRRDGVIVYGCNGDLCLTDTTGADRGKVPGSDNHRYPSWSPDGKVIAAVTESNVVTFDGNGRRVVTGRVTWKPAWFPDGSRIAFALNSQTQTSCNSTPCGHESGIWAARPDGSDPRPIAANSYSTHLALVRASS